MSDTDNLDPECQIIHDHHEHHSFYSDGQAPIHAVNSQGHVTGHHVGMHEMLMQGQNEGELQGHPEAQYHGVDSGHLHVHYMHGRDHGLSLHHNSDNGIGEEHDEGGGDNNGMEEGDVPSEGDNLGDPPSIVPVRSQATNQLTLSYQGEVYVFDTVPPEKVQAVLLLLGGREIPTGMPGMPIPSQYHQKGLSDVPQRFNLPQRIASLTRFREKRKERCFDKKIRYTVRKEVALRECLGIFRKTPHLWEARINRRAHMNSKMMGGQETMRLRGENNRFVFHATNGHGSSWNTITGVLVYGC